MEDHPWAVDCACSTLSLSAITDKKADPPNINAGINVGFCFSSLRWENAIIKAAGNDMRTKSEVIGLAASVDGVKKNEL